MPEYAVRVRLSAQLEVREAVEYYLSVNADVAGRFLDTMAGSEARLAENPERGPVWYRRRSGVAVRRLLVPRFPFALFYVVDEGIVLGAHQPRRLHAWEHPRRR